MTEAGGSRDQPNACCASGESEWFVLTPLEPGLHFKDVVQVNFAPQLNRETGVLESIEPELNLDGKAHTPCFILGVDKATIASADLEFLEAHLERIREQQGSDSSMFMPKPSKNHNRCHVCRVSFEDYLDHVDHPTHKNKLKQSAYNRQIAEMCSWAQLELGSLSSTERSPTKVESSLKRQRDYVLEEEPTKVLKKRKLASDCQIEETPELTQTAGRDEPDSTPINPADRLLVQLPSFDNNFAFQLPN